MPQAHGTAMQLLFERLATADPAGFDLAEAVRAQVQRLVGIHLWDGDPGLDLMDLGLAPLADVHHLRDLGQLSARLHALLARNEPRLELLRVDVEPASRAGAPPRLIVIGRLRGGSGEPESLCVDLPPH